MLCNYYHTLPLLVQVELYRVLTAGLCAPDPYPLLLKWHGEASSVMTVLPKDEVRSRA